MSTAEETLREWIVRNYADPDLTHEQFRTGAYELALTPEERKELEDWTARNIPALALPTELSVDTDRVFGIQERLTAAVEAELDSGDAQETFLALLSVLTCLIATMPHARAEAAMKLIREGLSYFVDGARSNLP